ncbi:hypothetical protein FGO68_gene11836 [Halteria grandinella]|uniref:WDHD1/CFT4 second beta-propeller domain-containing protein n=1 Tax=Halteria grandinella TaxID=5974 RepID=A0A8J8P3M3_HALGN|nr:hypothetical protein FGO68_gene11836 [Halteria grandinella]
MTEIKIESIADYHLGNKGGFTFFQDKLISTSEDSTLNVFKIVTNHKTQQSQLESVVKVDLDQESYQIVSNSVDKLAIGGDAQKVDIHTVVGDVISKETLQMPALATLMGSSIQRLQWVGRFVVVVSEDDEAQLYDSESERVIRFKNDAGVPFKCGALDPLNQFFAASACDGMLYIFSIPEESDGNSGSLIQKVKIAKGKVDKFGTDPLEVAWKGDGSQVYVSGEPLLGVVSRDTWGITYNKDYGHKKAITCIAWINDHVFATAGQDKVLKIWDTNKRALLNYITLDKPVTQITYCQKNKCLAFMNFECNLGVWYKDFSDAPKPLPIAAAAAVSEAPQKVQVDDYMNQEDVAPDDLPDNFFSQEDKQDSRNVLQPLKSQQSAKEPSITEQPKSTLGFGIKSQQSDTSLQKPLPPPQKTAPANQAPKQEKVQLVKSKADEIIDVYPQGSFMSNCQPDFTVGGKYKVLAWNLVGTVCLRQELTFTSVDVDFTDKQTHRNLVINDDYGAVMVALGHGGMLIASKGEGGEEEEMDEFIRPDDEDIDMENGDDEQKKLKRNAHILFKPFNTHKSLKDWHFALKHSEQVECVAMGSGWCAAATDFGYIRVFSHEGVQRTILCQGTPFVTLTAYENLLAVIYHAGPSVYGAQSLRLKLLDMSPTGPTSYAVIKDLECPISRYSNLVWIGYSEEGQLFTYDSEGVFRGLNCRNWQWTPVFDFKFALPGTYGQLWIVGVDASEILALEMPKGYVAPQYPQQRSMVRKFKFKFPFLEDDSQQVGKKEAMNLANLEESLAKEQFNIDHENYRRENWEPLKHFRSKYDSDYFQSASILSVTELANKKKEMDKHTLNAIRLSIVNQDEERVFSYMELLNYSQSLKIVIQLCESLNASDLSQKIARFITEKESKDVMLDSYKAQSSKMHTAQSSGLENRRLLKTAISSTGKQDLASYAINGNSMTQKATLNKSSSQESIEVPEIADTKPQVQVAPPKPVVTTPAANPFAKKPADAKKQDGASDIFKDLSTAPQQSKGLPQPGAKRANPFESATANANKQKKLK